jgi:urease accessory protein
MRATASIEAVAGPDGATRIVRCAGQPPLVPRVTGPGVVHLVGAAGGPHPGDVLGLSISVGPGAMLTIEQVAATMAMPGPDPLLPSSVLTVEVDVAAGGSLAFLGQPLVAVAGCRHRTEARIRLHGDARVIWRELLVPGRSDEPSGDVALTLDVSRDGSPVLQQELRIGPGAPGWDSSAVAGSARCIGSELRSGPDEWRPAQTVRLAEQAVLVPLAAPGSALITALGDAVDVVRVLSLPAAAPREYVPSERSGSAEGREHVQG